MPTPLRPPPLRNRGAAAWARDDAQPIFLSVRHPDVLPVVSRAMVHAVTDDTNAEYNRVVQAAVQAVVHSAQPAAHTDVPRMVPFNFFFR